MITSPTVTLRHIAQDTGVSAATVSYVLNGRRLDRISATTQQRVLDAARKHGYRPNELARAVVTGKSRVIGVLMHDSEPVGEHVTAMLAGTLREASLKGYAAKLLQLPLHSTPDQLEPLLQRCNSWRLDGIVAITLDELALRLLRVEMKNSNVPIAYIDSIPDTSQTENAIRVTTDDYSGIYAAIEHLAQLGHHHITLLSGPIDREMTVSRNAFFLQVMRELSLPITQNSIIQSHWSKAPIIEKSVHDALDLAERPTALFCAGDTAALVAMRTARRRGLCVPDDLSVIGFSDVPQSAHADPPLTTIRQAFRQMGQAATQALLDRLDDDKVFPDDKTTSQFIGASLVVRESTAPPCYPLTRPLPIPIAET